MDRQEYREIINEIRISYRNRDFERVIMFAQEIPTKKIKENNVLEMIANAYDQVGKPSIARSILEIAYRKMPGGKQTAYKMSVLSLKLKDIEGAVQYYEEFCKIAPNDNQRFILKYEIATEGGLSLYDRIRILEEYTAKETDDKWMYELARLYHEAGMADKCVQMCDDIVVWFSDGEYLKRALELKFSHKALTPTQQAMYERIMQEYIEDYEEPEPEAAPDFAEYEADAEEFANDFLGDDANKNPMEGDTKPIRIPEELLEEAIEEAEVETAETEAEAPENEDFETDEKPKTSISLSTIKGEAADDLVAEVASSIAKNGMAQPQSGKKNIFYDFKLELSQPLAPIKKETLPDVPEEPDIALPVGVDSVLENLPEKEEQIFASVDSALQTPVVEEEISEEAAYVSERLFAGEEKVPELKPELEMTYEPAAEQVIETPELEAQYQKKKLKVSDGQVDINLSLLNTEESEIAGQLSIDQLFQTYANNIENNLENRAAVAKVEAERLRQIREAVESSMPSVPALAREEKPAPAEPETAPARARQVILEEDTVAFSKELTAPVATETGADLKNTQVYNKEAVLAGVNEELKLSGNREQKLQAETQTETVVTPEKQAEVQAEPVFVPEKETEGQLAFFAEPEAVSPIEDEAEAEAVLHIEDEAEPEAVFRIEDEPDLAYEDPVDKILREFEEQEKLKEIARRDEIEEAAEVQRQNHIEEKEIEIPAFLKNLSFAEPEEDDLEDDLALLDEPVTDDAEAETLAEAVEEAFPEEVVAEPGVAEEETLEVMEEVVEEVAPATSAMTEDDLFEEIMNEVGELPVQEAETTAETAAKTEEEIAAELDDLGDFLADALSFASAPEEAAEDAAEEVAQEAAAPKRELTEEEELELDDLGDALADIFGDLEELEAEAATGELVEEVIEAEPEAETETEAAIEAVIEEVAEAEPEAEVEAVVEEVVEETVEPEVEAEAEEVIEEVVEEAVEAEPEAEAEADETVEEVVEAEEVIEEEAEEEIPEAELADETEEDLIEEVFEEVSEEVLEEAEAPEEVPEEAAEEEPEEEFEETAEEVLEEVAEEEVEESPEEAYTEEPEEAPEEVEDLYEPEAEDDEVEEEITEEIAEEPETVVAGDSMEEIIEEAADESQLEDLVEDASRELSGDTQPIERIRPFVMSRDMREELAEFLLVDGMDDAITDTINDIILTRRSGDSTGGHLIITGDKKIGKTFLTISIIKAINIEFNSGTGKVAKVQSDSLNGKNIEKVFQKIAGNDLIIENVGDLEDQTLSDILSVLASGTVRDMVVFEGNMLALDTIITNHPEVKTLFKNRLDVSELTITQWADVACDYASRKGYHVGDMALLALHAKIDEINMPTTRFGYEDIVNIMETAIERCEKRNTGKLFSAFSKKEDEKIELNESDFI